jgi:hypothetical protein
MAICRRPSDSRPARVIGHETLDELELRIEMRTLDNVEYRDGGGHSPAERDLSLRRLQTDA